MTTSQSPALPPIREGGRAHALLFGVEHYDDPEFDRVAYAERDASEISKALLALGYAAADVKLIVNEQATTTRIDHEISDLAGRAEANDSVFIFFAGHGYTYNGINYLVGRDASRKNVPGTSVSLRDMFGVYHGSLCRQVMFFLDCCHSGMKLAAEGRDILEVMSHEELKDFFGAAEFQVVFSSCDKGELSYPSNQYQHGYWSYQLLRALRGELPHLLDEHNLLRSTRLQDYLRVEVPKQVALQRADNRSQHPKMYGDVSGTFVIADLTSVLTKREAERSLRTSGLKHITLRGIESGSVRNLSGFDKAKRHTVPTTHSSSTRSWIPTLAEDELKEEMEEFFAIIRKTRRYKNKDLVYDPPSGGGASIRTPEFHFSSSYSQSETDPAEYRRVQELVRLNEPALLEEEWFNNMFRGTFNTAVFEFSSSLDLIEFIDKVEEINGLDLSYDAERTKCTITLNGFDGKVFVRPDSVICRFNGEKTPKEIAVGLQKIQAGLLQLPGLSKALPA